MNRFLSWALRGAAIWAFGTCLAGPVLAHGPNASPAAGARDHRAFEIRFLSRMIDHHAMAVHMAEACSTRARHPELLALAQRIRTAQRAEIVTMRSWLQSWYRRTHAPEMKPAEMREMQKLEALTGDAFEVAFLEGMVGHHTAAVKEADGCLRRADHVELRNVCQEIHEAQKSEIVQMKEWLCQWYRRCR